MFTAVRPKRPQSWTSTPDLDESQSVKNNHNFNNSNSGSDSQTPDVEVNIPLPRRRHTIEMPSAAEESSFTLRRPPLPPKDNEDSATTILRTDTLAERVRKMQLLKKQNSLDRENRSRQSSTEK